MLSVGLRSILLEEEENKKNEVKIKRRQLRDASNPMELPINLFKKYFRINKDAFTYLLEIISSATEEPRTVRGIPPILKLSASLRFFAEGCYQTSVGKDFDLGLAQSTFSDILLQVLGILEEKLCPEYIKLPTSLEKRTISHEFFLKYKIPGVVGCVDGTHVSIVTPSKDRHLFYNRKGVNSMNVMLICDHEQRIRYVDARRPGSCHDAFIWNVSNAKSVMETAFNDGERSYHLLGDSGYPLEPWLLTPFRLPTKSHSEEKFNEAHTKCRNIIERTNGVLKNRWRCLIGDRVLHYTPLKATKIINVCCALHNVCIHFNVGWDNHDIATSTDVEQPDFTDYGERNQNQLQIAKAIRLHIANTL